MLVEGHYILVFNYDTLLKTAEKKEDCMREAVRHSAGISRGHYEIFKLESAAKSGTVGDALRWE